MKELMLRIVTSLTILSTLWACNPSSTDNPVESGNTLSVQIHGIESGKKIAPAEGDSFFVRISSRASWELSVMPAEASQWIQIDHVRGGATNGISVTVFVSPNTATEPRKAQIQVVSGSERQVLYIEQIGRGGKAPEPQGDASRIEVPRLQQSGNNFFVSHYSEGVVNYSLEYDADRRHARWVAFTFDAITSKNDGKGRSNAWQWDPQVPSEYSTDNWFQGTGYSRGHLVASSDRYYSREANRQTFYYTNVSPQRSGHNEGIWQKLEAKVQQWGRSSEFRDVLYVAKGGTIRDDQIEKERIRGLIVIPKHYWMALVAKKGNAYKALAFWTDHKQYPRNTKLSTLTLSIDELEKKTGLDFFHNLDDGIEQKIEAEVPDLKFWTGL